MFRHKAWIVGSFVLLVSGAAQAGELLESKISVDDGVVFDDFGVAVATAGGIVAVGVPRDDDAGLDAGTVQIFERGPGDWQRTAKLLPKRPRAYENFGSSVATDGELLVVGATGSMFAGSTDSGNVSVYRRLKNNKKWMLTAKLYPSVPRGGDRFGIAVALDGDRIVVGASGRSGSSPTVVGAAYVFRLERNSWVEEAMLQGPNDANAAFGFAVDIDGDRVIVGAYNEFLAWPASGSGAAYIFRRVGQEWIREARLAPAEGSDDEIRWFGRAVAIAPGTALVGAPMSNIPFCCGAGSAHFYSNASGDWIEDARMVPASVAPGDRFGSATALCGDQAFVGAPRKPRPGEPPFILGTGVVYPFSRAAGGWSEGEVLEPSDDANSFGAPLSLAPKLLVAGAPQPDPQPAAVYAYASIEPFCPGS